MNIKNQIKKHEVALKVIDARLQLPPTGYTDLLVRYQYISDRLEITANIRKTIKAQSNKKYHESKKVEV